MNAPTYLHRRAEIETYFDRTAAEAWARMTSDAPLSRIRATVRAGRERMRDTLLSWLPEDLQGRRVLDAGCGTGALATTLARRGAQVLAIDLSPTLVDLARQRCAAQRDRDLLLNRIHFCSGDMLDPALGGFDHVVAMDSLIHYGAQDVLRVLGQWGPRTRGSLLFTFAPRTPLLAAMHTVGRLFPRGDRAPSIVPVAAAQLHAQIAQVPELRDWTSARSQRIVSGFYTSQATEWCRP